jgi:GT2 family glycosyltransferase
VLIPIEVIEKVGFFDQKNFPHYVSDYDYFLRAKKAGYKLFLSTKAIVYNKTTLTGFRPSEKILSADKIFTKLFSRRSAGNISNEILFRWKHSSGLARKFINISKLIFTKLFWAGNQLLKNVT